MNGALNGFNWLARHYDALTKLVFGQAIYDSQVEFLAEVPPGSVILIIGGGTGGILSVLGKMNPSASILYVEASSEMLRLAERNVSPEYRTRIEFVHGTESSIPEGMVFDVIITNFFLDLFTDSEVQRICQDLSTKLRPQGRWLASDFVRGGKWWHGFMLWTMYRFFRFTCSIKASRLPSWEGHLKTGMAEKVSRSFCHGFIKSGLYVKDA
ncbi:MAG: class I SAM-dependent methyltransferase [Chryseosolibacter sp.]